MSQKSGSTSKKSGKRNLLVADTQLSSTRSISPRPNRQSPDSHDDGQKYSTALVPINDHKGAHGPLPSDMEAQGDPPSYPADDSTVYDLDDRVSMTTGEDSDVDEPKKPSQFHPNFKMTHTTTKETGLVVNGNIVDNDKVLTRLARLGGDHDGSNSDHAGIHLNAHITTRAFIAYLQQRQQHQQHKKV